MARPGGNATGFTSYEFSLSAKLLEMLKEISPGVTRVAVIRDAAVAASAVHFANAASAKFAQGVKQIKDLPLPAGLSTSERTHSRQLTRR